MGVQKTNINKVKKNLKFSMQSMKGKNMAMGFVAIAASLVIGCVGIFSVNQNVQNNKVESYVNSINVLQSKNNAGDAQYQYYVDQMYLDSIKDNLDEMLELCRIIISMYYAQSKTKDVRDIDFITYTLRAKPNSKDKNELRRRQIIEKWLDENSPAYRKRKSRALTKISYNKAVLTYFTLVIQQANK